MWEWLRSLFYAPEERPDPGLFKPKQRLIYRHYAGRDAQGNDVYVDKDPLPLWKRLMEKGPEIGVNIRVANSQHSQAAKKQTELVEQLRWVFELKPFPEGGLTETECLLLLDHFMDYVGVEKKNTPTSPTSAPPGAPGSSPDSAPSTAGPPDTESSSGSGSTETGSPSEQPSP